MMFRRPIVRRWPTHHPVTHATPGGTPPRGGSPAFAITGLPCGVKVNPFSGMDPSDQSTWVRPYRPVPGMVWFTNFDGAVPNQSQTVAR